VKSRLLAAGFAVLAIATAASAHSVQTFTLIDRTMVCTTALSGGAPDQIRTLRVSVSSKSGSGPQQFDPGLSVHTGHFSLVAVRTQEAPRVFANVTVHRHRCTRVDARLPLLREERSAQPADFYSTCKVLDAPRQIIVRLRAVFERPTFWRVYRRDSLQARGKAVEASVTVRTHPARKPLAFVSFDRNGSARFFNARRCTTSG
jgi:hypothetical protein